MFGCCDDRYENEVSSRSQGFSEGKEAMRVYIRELLNKISVRSDIPPEYASKFSGMLLDLLSK